MSEKKIIKTMRCMEWERVKGGLNAILHSYWPDYDNPKLEPTSNYSRFEEIVDKFIEQVEEEDLSS